MQRHCPDSLSIPWLTLQLSFQPLNLCLISGYQVLALLGAGWPRTITDKVEHDWLSRGRVVVRCVVDARVALHSALVICFISRRINLLLHTQIESVTPSANIRSYASPNVA
jgi:hypothetical protein